MNYVKNYLRDINKSIRFVYFCHASKRCWNYEILIRFLTRSYCFVNNNINLILSAKIIYFGHKVLILVFYETVILNIMYNNSYATKDCWWDDIKLWSWWWGAQSSDIGKTFYFNQKESIGDGYRSNIWYKSS